MTKKYEQVSSYNKIFSKKKSVANEKSDTTTLFSELHRRYLEWKDEKKLKNFMNKFPDNL